VIVPRTRARARARWADGGAILLTLLTLACGGAGQPAVQQPPDPLPADGFLEAWHRDGELRVFTGPELYNHINGGAEVFLELGFERLEVQRYVAGDAQLAVELYHMHDPEAAFGIYLMKCGAETPSPDLEVRHTVGPYQLQLCSGASYLVVNRLAGDDLDQGVLVAFAQHVAEQLGPAHPVTIFDPLPTADRIEGSERVVRGPYTLEALYTFGHGDVFELAAHSATAVAADYEAGDGSSSTRLHVPYADPETADAVFAALPGRLDGELEVLESSAERLVFRDFAGRFGDIAIRGAALEARVGLGEQPTAETDEPA
jgi:hypothetical protein